MQRKRAYEIAIGLALVGVGGAMTVMGFVEFDRLSSAEALGMEAAGRVQALGHSVDLIYAQAGKWGVLACCGIIGFLGLFVGGNKLIDGGRDRDALGLEPSAPDPVRLVRERLAKRERAVPLAVNYVRKLRERSLASQQRA
jgi:hypothetical protein